MLWREDLDAIQGEEELKIERLLGPEGALVTFATKATRERFAAVSFHEGSGSAAWALGTSARPRAARAMSVTHVVRVIGCAPWRFTAEPAASWGAAPLVAAPGTHELLHHLVNGKAPRRLPRWELLEALHDNNMGRRPSIFAIHSGEVLPYIEMGSSKRRPRHLVASIPQRRPSTGATP